MLIEATANSHLTVTIGYTGIRFAWKTEGRIHPLASYPSAEAGRLLFRRNEPLACLEYLEGHEHGTPDPETIEIGALAALALRRQDVALDEILEAVEMRRRALGDALLARERGGDASDALDAEVEAARRGLYRALQMEALIWTENGNDEAALARLDDAAALMPSEVPAHVNRMAVYTRQGRHDLIEGGIEAMDGRLGDWRSNRSLMRAVLMVLPELEEEASSMPGRACR